MSAVGAGRTAVRRGRLAAEPSTRRLAANVVLYAHAARSAACANVFRQTGDKLVHFGAS